MLKRPDLNWRALNWLVAKAVIRMTGIMEGDGLSAFVIDDTLKARLSRKIDMASKFFDHSGKQYRNGHQVVAMGLATEQAFLPLDSQIKVGSKEVQESGTKKAWDGRCAAARRREEGNQTKIEIANGMIRRIWRLGIRPQYLVADSWYGTKSLLETAAQLDLTAVVRMRKSRLKYRIIDDSGKQIVLDAAGLYRRAARGSWRKVGDLRRCASVIAEVNLNTSKSKKAEPRWRTVKLLFVRGISDDAGKQPGSKNWALFLSADPGVEDEEMLQVYALRWSIEVCFREAKQRLGFLQEQTRNAASHCASAHLCAIRFLVLTYEQVQRQERSAAAVRGDIARQMAMLSFAQQLWLFFRCLVHGTLEQFRDSLGDLADQIMEAIDAVAEGFFVRSLQLDAETIGLEHDDSLEDEHDSHHAYA
jgi:SRSO17 transposase